MMPHVSSVHIGLSVYGLADKITDLTITLTVVGLALFGWIRYFS